MTEGKGRASVEGARHSERGRARMMDGWKVLEWRGRLSGDG